MCVGNVQRMDSNEMAKKIMENTPMGKENVTWMDEWRDGGYQILKITN